MSFCSNCGTKLADDTKFCPKCGGAVGGSVVPRDDYLTQAASALALKKHNVKEANRVYEYFIKKKDQYNELSRCRVFPETIKTPKPYYWLWWFAILTAFAAVSEPGFEVLGMLIGVALIVVFFINRKSYKNRVARCDQLLLDNQIRFDELCDELGEYYDAYGDCPIGAEYTFPETLQILVDYVNSGRADSLKEAINLMISDGQMQQIQMNTQQAAQSANAAAVFSALDFFFN